MGYFRILAAIPGFFLSSFILMLLWGAICPDFGIESITYVKSMLITITLWLAVAPLTAVGKKINVVDEYEDVIRKVHAHGIAIHGFFIFGLDADEVNIFDRTLYFAQKMRLESAQFAWPVPYPGTTLAEEMDKAGRIVTKDWSQYESTLVLEPRKMSRETLQQKRDWVWRKFYTLPSIWKRLGVIRRYSVLLWVLNLYLRSFWRRKYREERKL